MQMGQDGPGSEMLTRNQWQSGCNWGECGTQVLCGLAKSIKPHSWSGYEERSNALSATFSRTHLQLVEAKAILIFQDKKSEQNLGQTKTMVTFGDGQGHESCSTQNSSRTHQTKTSSIPS